MQNNVPYMVKIQKHKKKASKNWNQTHKDQRNAINRASYARNKTAICKRKREKRKLARESKQ